MRVAGVEMSVLEIEQLERFPWQLEDFLRLRGVEFKLEHMKELMDVWLAVPYEEIAAARAARTARTAQRPPEARRGKRCDAEELKRFMEKRPRLPPRVRDVYDLCVRDGRTIDECAQRLKIGRESVRTHLRRLRAYARGVPAGAISRPRARR